MSCKYFYNDGISPYCLCGYKDEDPDNSKNYHKSYFHRSKREWIIKNNKCSSWDICDHWGEDRQEVLEL